MKKAFSGTVDSRTKSLKILFCTELKLICLSLSTTTGVTKFDFDFILYKKATQKSLIKVKCRIELIHVYETARRLKLMERRVLNLASMR